MEKGIHIPSLPTRERGECMWVWHYKDNFPTPDAIRQVGFDISIFECTPPPPQPR